MQEQEFQEWTGVVLEEIFEMGGRVLACLLAVLSMLEDLLDEIV